MELLVASGSASLGLGEDVWAWWETVALSWEHLHHQLVGEGRDTVKEGLQDILKDPQVGTADPTGRNSLHCHNGGLAAVHTEEVGDGEGLRTFSKNKGTFTIT